jgi:hypothetical protein
MTPAHPDNLPDSDRPRRPGPDLAAARERTTRILTEGFSRGLLDMDEFERRIEASENASNPVELSALVTDLPETLERQAVPQETQILHEEPDHHLGIMSERTLKGDWLRSRRNKVFSLMSSQRFDFRATEIPPEGIELDILAVMAEVVITVPPGVAVKTSVLPIMGECKEDRNIPRKASTGVPVIKVRGTAIMASVVVRQKP